MITPRFNLMQNDKSLTITIRAPYCSLRELDLSVEDNAFIFYCRPYYLRLNLPGNIVENDRASSKFDAAEGEFTFTYDKETPGEHFPDLDFVTKLLCSKINVEEGGRKMELLTTEIGASAETSSPPETIEEYGFAMRGGYNINNLDTEFCDVFKINPQAVKLKDRGTLRLKQEKEKFDPDHYIADFLEDEEIKSICMIECPYEAVDAFTPKELDFLKDLSNVDYNLNASQIRHCHCGLLEILFAYCYDRRSTFFEGTCESGWTISTLSASLSWFDGFADAKSAITCAYRRSLIFPLYRSFELCERVFDDLKALLGLGEKFLVRCLIEIYYVFLGGDSGHFILNNLFVKDYVVCIMKWDKGLWSDVVEVVSSMKIEKCDLGLGLLEIEQSVDSTHRLTNLFNGLQLADGEESGDSTDSDDSSDSSTTGSQTESDDDVYKSCENLPTDNV